MTVTTCPNVYNTVALRFLKNAAASEEVYTARNQRRYSEEDVRLLADYLIKEGAFIGSGGMLWDTDMNAADNMSGWGGNIGAASGSVLGATAGGTAGLAAGGVGSVPGAMVGGAAGGAAA